MSNTAFLEDICEILDSQRVPVTSKDRTKGIYPYYGANGVQDYIDDYIFDDELVLLAEDGGYFGSKEKPIAYRVSGKFWVNNHAHVLKAKDCIDIDYLCYSLMFYDVSSLVNGATRQKLNQAVMRKMTIPLPELEQQYEIVSKLDKVTHTIVLCNQIIEKLDLFVKARFVEMFGDIYTNKYNFPICQLSDYIFFLTSGSRGWAKYCVDDGSEWFITIKNVKDCKITTDNIQPVNAPDNMEAKRTKVEEGDLLISITADLGRTGVVTREIAEHGSYINQHLTCVRLEQSKLMPLFVACFMESDSGKAQFEAKNQTGVKAGLNFDSIKSLKLLIPSLDLQEQFVAFVELIDKSKSAVKQVLEKAETLKKALMQEYFG
ncbi:MAG: restriction endonuclease subunit S [Ruminococcus flavefaciens]|nr:restriction endonuclease subunit S [Ruminococcus flavefaciens]